MPITLTTASSTPFDGYKEQGIQLDFAAGTVRVSYVMTYQGNPVSGSPLGHKTTAPITEAAFEALSGASIRLKACQAIANDLGLTAATYTIT
jgi:hypothetical protein